MLFSFMNDVMFGLDFLENKLRYKTKIYVYKWLPFIGCKLIFFSETKICKVTLLFGTCTSMTESCGVQTSVIHILEKKRLYTHINALFKATVLQNGLS